MTVRMFLGDALVTAIASDDRGLAYGESLFETMRAYHGEVPWWDAHMARLKHGAERLSMPLPDAAQMHAEAHALLEGKDGVLSCSSLAVAAYVATRLLLKRRHSGCCQPIHCQRASITWM